MAHAEPAAPPEPSALEVASPSTTPPAAPEQAVCVATTSIFVETFPFQHRHGIATVRLQEVRRFGAAILLCDCLHDGPHE